MAHVRTQLRQAVATLLAIVVSSGGRVSVNRQVPQPGDDLLRLTVRTPEEVARTSAQDGQQERRIRLQAQVSGRAGNEEALSDLLDIAASEIEELMAAAPTLGDLAFDTEYVGSALQIDAANDRFSGGLTLNYDVTILTEAGSPDAAV